MPEVTIITPTYQHEAFIGPCIESVLAQTVGDWEMVVVDDASTDRTGEVVASYQDPRIVYDRREARGGAEALQGAYERALLRSAGRYVAILEGDDRWPTDKLEVQLQAFEDGVDLTWGVGAVIDEGGLELGRIDTLRPRRVHVDLDPSAAFRSLLRRNIVAPTCTAMVRRTALDAVGGFRASPHRFLVDLPTWMALASRGSGRFRFVRHLLGFWRRHPGQQTFTRGAELSEEHALLLEELLDGGTSSTGVTPDVLRAYIRFHRARASLLGGEDRDARRGFASVLRRPGGLDARTLGACLLGLVGSVVGRDLVEDLSALRRGSSG